jgi:hypothetical protein
MGVPYHDVHLVVHLVGVHLMDRHLMGLPTPIVTKTSIFVKRPKRDMLDTLTEGTHRVVAREK